MNFNIVFFVISGRPCEPADLHGAGNMGKAV